MPKEPEAFTRVVGRSRLRFESAVSRKLNWSAEATCVKCGRVGTLRYGSIVAVFRVGNEFIGVMCDECLSPESKADAVRLREKARESSKH